MCFCRFTQTGINVSSDQDRITGRHNKQQHNVRPGAEWDRAPSPAAPPAPQNGDAGVLSSESYFAIDCEQQQQQLCMNRGFQSVEQQKIQEPGVESEATISPSPAHSLEADLDVPIETDIDDFQEEELITEDLPITSELPCFALPVTVLETDIDALTDSEVPPSGRTGAESSSVDDDLEAGEGSREGPSPDELLYHSSEGELGLESWRGAYQATDPSTDSLDR